MSIIVTTANPSLAMNAAITASYGAGSASAAVSVVPASATLTSIALSPTTVTGGLSANATVTLGAPAPAGGALVALASSSSALATVPMTVLVSEGATAASFTITTSPVGAAANVTIFATYGTTSSASLALTPCNAMGRAQAPPAAPLDVVWIDDALPAGAIPVGPAVFTSAQAASGAQSIQLPPATGLHQWSFSGAPALTPGANDRLVVYALINPCNPPRELLLSWSDAAGEYRASWGEELVEATTPHVRLGSLPPGGQWIPLEVSAAAIGAASRNLTGFAIKAYDGEIFLDRFGTAACALPPVAAPASLPADAVWFDDAVPAGASYLGASYGSWIWESAQKASGTMSHRLPAAAGKHWQFFDGATTGMSVAAGDVIVTYVLINPCSPTREILLQFGDESGSWEHRAYFGESLFDDGVEATPSRYRIGPLPTPGQWARLEIPAYAVGLEGHTVRGMSFALWDGEVWFDRTGRFARTNVALGRTATQSSDAAANATADRAVDGNLGGDATLGQVAMTASQSSPWWQVDLGAIQPIDNVELWNRTDGFASRLSSFWLFVSDTPFASTDIALTRAQPGVSSYRYDATAGRSVNFLVNRTGRYVRVQLGGNDVLQLAEVQVWAPASPSRVNLAGGRIVTQSSNYDPSTVPERAVNGNVTSDWSRELSITVTNNDAQAWWQVDLGSVQAISTVDVWNRIANPERLANFYVFVSDAPFTSTSIASTIAQPGVGVYFYGSPFMAGYSIPVNRTGRYVRVQLTATEYLSLTEVQVWSANADDLKPLAVKRGTDVVGTNVVGPSGAGPPKFGRNRSINLDRASEKPSPAGRGRREARVRGPRAERVVKMMTISREWRPRNASAPAWQGSPVTPPLRGDPLPPGEGVRSSAPARGTNRAASEGGPSLLGPTAFAVKEGAQ